MASSKKLFLNDIEKFLSRHSMTATAFGVGLAKSPNFVFDLRKGRACGLDVVDRVDLAMQKFDEGGE